MSYKPLTLAAILVTAMASLAANTSAQTNVPYVCYNRFNGDVIFKSSGQTSDLVGLRIDSPNGDLMSTNATDLDGAISGPFSVLNNASPDFVEWGNLLGFTLEGDVFAGNLLPTRISFPTLINDYTFRARLASAPTEDVFLSICIPEPGTPALAALALAFLPRRRT